MSTCIYMFSVSDIRVCMLFHLVNIWIDIRLFVPAGIRVSMLVSLYAQS